jgi:hypothetical protein
MVEAHLGNGNFEASKIFAYVYLEHVVHSPHLFVRQAMEQVCGAPAFRLAASSRGVGVMVFGDQETREQIVALSPIVFDGNTITVERHEEADNRFYAYAEIASTPMQEALAKEALGFIGNVCCIDPDCLPDDELNPFCNFTSLRAVIRLDHEREVPERLLVRNHSGPASIARIHTIRTWLDANPVPDFSNYSFGPHPDIHTAPAYHLTGNPPTQLPAHPENLVATVLEWEIPTATPTLRPVHSRQPTPYPRAATLNPSLLTLPWYGVGGVPEREETPLEEPAMGSAVEEEAASALAELSLVPPPNLNTGEHTESEHVSRAQKRRARRKRARDSAHKIRRSLRLKEKEEANFELPEEKAARVQQAKFDFSGASRRLRNALIF